MLRGGDQAVAQTGAFVADEQRAGTSERSGVCGSASASDGCRGEDVMLRQQADGVVFGGRDGGNAEGGAGRGAESFGVPGAGGSRQQQRAGGAEGFCGAQERADIAGVLQAGEDEDQGELAEERFDGEGRRMDERCDALRLLGGDGAGEDIGCEKKLLGVGREFDAGRVVLAEKGCDEPESAAQGFRDEVLAFDGDQAGGGAAAVREGGAQLFDTRILAALDQAGRRVGCAGGHRGDFTPGDGAVSCLVACAGIQEDVFPATFRRALVSGNTSRSPG